MWAARWIRRTGRKHRRDNRSAEPIDYLDRRDSKRRRSNGWLGIVDWPAADQRHHDGGHVPATRQRTAAGDFANAADPAGDEPLHGT